jgi:type III secretion system FlhB-like substrate exporter
MARYVPSSSARHDVTAIRPRRVVGLSHGTDSELALPRVVFKGAGPIADHLLENFARQRGRQRVVRDDALLDRLFRLPTEAAISPDLYPLVASLLVHVFAVEARMRNVPNA